MKSTRPGDDEQRVCSSRSGDKEVDDDGDGAEGAKPRAGAREDDLIYQNRHLASNPTS